MTTPSRTPSDRELGDILRYLARVCLETERGLRPPEQLTRFMDPRAALRFRTLLRLGRFDGGAIQPTDIGEAHLSRHGDGTVFATVVTRTEGRRWGALSFKLREHEGRWQIADIQRLLATRQRLQDRIRMIDNAPDLMSRSR
jgi:hypothetical protein